MLGAALETSEVTRVVAEQAVRILDNADRAMLFLRFDSAAGLALHASHSPLDLARQAAYSAQQADRLVFESGKPYLCSRTAGEMFRFAEGEPTPVASFASVPIWMDTDPNGRAGKRQCVGVLRVSSSYENAFSRTDIEMLNIVATLAGMSLQNAALYDRCKQLAILDSLTGLYSRHYFLERFNEEITRCAREHVPLSFLMMDIDNFKSYNDRYGHPAGDVVLQQMSERLRSQGETGDIFVRYGGEEFGALRQADYASALAWAERLRASVEQARLGPQEGAVRITLSIGVAAYPTHGAKMAEIIEHADKAMYKAKQAGKNQVG
jgi:diguanylate cyclase (GGDEF)-like protein